MKFVADLSDMRIGIQCGDEFTKEKCKNYILESDSVPDFSIEVNPQEVMKEDERGFSFGYRESITVYEKIAEKLPLFGRCVFHGAVITMNDDGYLFTAASGTGKSTHILLWKEYLGKYVDIVNGDKPILNVTEDAVIAYGTPWCGKEDWQKKRKASLKGICIIERGTENSICRLTAKEAILPLYKQIFIPKDGMKVTITL